MIKLTKGEVPQLLVENGAAWTAVWVDHVENGTPISSTAKGRYREAPIKEAILQETHEKCAYCESKVTHTYPGDVEHIFPKRKCPDLFVEWSNLTLGCRICNGKKSDYYDPVEPLVNPYLDEPADHLAFHGPLVFHVPGSAEGERTRLLLRLSRSALVERRTERINSLKTLIDRYVAQPEGTLKQLIHDEIQQEVSEDREFSAALKQFANDHAGI